MIAHLPACALGRPPKRALVVGGGDGGVLRELSRHASLEEIHIAEIDGMVIDVSKKYFPQMAVGYSDPRVQVCAVLSALSVSQPIAGCSDSLVGRASAGQLMRSSAGAGGRCGGAPDATRSSHRALCPPRRFAAAPQVHVCDGIKYVQDAPEGHFDIIVVDSSDPVGPAEVLFQKARRGWQYRGHTGSTVGARAVQRLTNCCGTAS